MEDSPLVVDFSAYSLDRAIPDPERIQQLVRDVHKALTTIGFMYLHNFGIPAAKVKDAFYYSKKFFKLPVDDKLQYLTPEGGIQGYVQMETECLNANRRYKDLKESFNYCPAAGDEPFPDKEVPDFQTAIRGLFQAAIPLHNRVLEVMAMGLELEDTQYFVDRHKYIGTRKNRTAFRTLYYPALTNVVVKEDQVRCGEHSDFGGITLLFQDSQAGLEVKNLHGQWVPVEPIEGTVVVNIGDLMQRWTSDKLIASKHRVMLPVEQVLRQQARQSIAFFGNPDIGTVIECIDKSNKYPPIDSIAYIDLKCTAMFQDPAQ